MSKTNVTVGLIGFDGNAFRVLGAVIDALREANIPEMMIKEFYDEATRGDYDHLLQTVMDWVEVN